VLFSADSEDLGWLASVPHVRSVEREGSRVTVHGEEAVLAHVGAALVAHGLTPSDLRVELPSLEDAYMAIVGDGRS
jgi:ABC-2 type transport system ATP-binding protein